MADPRRLMQVRFSSAIGVAALRAAVRQRSRLDFRRIMQFGQPRVIPLAIFWVYGSRCLILAATQRPRGLLLERVYPVSRWSWLIASPVIPMRVIPRRKRLPFRPEAQEIAIARGSILLALVDVVLPQLGTTFQLVVVEGG